MPKAPNKPPKLYGISRHLHEKTQTWSWRVNITRKGKLVANRNFADLKHGGEDKALALAIAFRDEVIAAHPPLSRSEHAQIVRRNNTSGIPGVYCIARSGKALRWEARTQMPSGKSLTKSFNIAYYGEEEAKRLAIEERARQLAHLEGEVFLHSPAARQLQRRLQGQTQDRAKRR